MNIKQYITLAVISALSFGANAQAVYEEKVTSASNVGMTVSSLGIIGNSFSGSFSVKGYPSCQYPKGSGVEHIFDGGLWVGGLINGSQIAVSSGAIDASSGYSTGRAGFEFTQSGSGKLTERSSLFDSPNYAPGSVSHQDFICDFTDKNVIVPGTSIPVSEHQFPMGLDVHFETYNWNYNFANFFVLTNIKVTNGGTNTIDSVYLGFWADGVVRNVNITPPGGTPFYNKGGNGYIDSLSMAYEFDATGDPGYTDSYVGLKYLGADDKYGFHHPALDTNFKCHYNTWQFSNTADPLYFYPQTDNQKYGKMTIGLNHNINVDFEAALQSLKTPNNRSSLISVGPFKSLAPGESITISFGIILGKKYQDGQPNTADNDIQKSILVQNASWAQTAYNGEDINFNGILDAGEDRDKDGEITRFILPAPPDVPNTKIVAGINSIDIYWASNSEDSFDPISKKKDFEGYNIYLTSLGHDIGATLDIEKSLKLLSQYDAKGNSLFNNNGFDEIKLKEPVTFEGDSIKYTYKYTISNLPNGWQYVVSLTAFDTGDPENNLESLETSPLSSAKYVFPGTVANASMDKVNNLSLALGKNKERPNDPYVYPNPYYGSAAWEGVSKFEEDRKLVFANLPKRCEIRVYTVNGDLVDVFTHDASYKGEDIKWYQTYAGDDADARIIAGGEHGWDLLSKDTQLIARGLYTFTVHDLDSGEKYRGQFVIIK